MRAPSLLSPAASVSQKLWPLFAVAGTAVSALNFASVSQPELDLSQLGRSGLVGDFDSISIYEFSGQAESSPFLNGSQSLLTTLPNGLFTELSLADSAINALCVYVLKDGTEKGIVVGGNFTSLGNVEAKGIAMYDLETNKVTAMDDFDGKVNALLCDKSTNRVYVGGSFSHNNSTNAIAWEDGKWVDLPFEGFSDPIDTIAMSNNKSIIFGGKFDSVNNSTNLTTIKNAQTLNIGSASITAEQTTDLAGFNDPAAITCSNSTDTQWLLKDGQVGSWTADFRFQFHPTKLRLTNANHEGRGTKVFRFTAFPIDGIMNLTYTNTTTNEKHHCDAWCPLAQSDEPQDFEFINDVGMSSFRLDIWEHYGAGGGLSGVEIFQDDIYTFAVPALNEPSCVSSTLRSNASVGGSWTTESLTGADSDYLSTNITSDQLSSTEIVFEPHIQQSGKYQVLMYTPGCIRDNSCDTRGEVNVTGVFTKDGKAASSVTFFQTNNFDKYDTVYTGQVDAIDGSFRPRVTLTPTSSQAHSTVNIVASKVQFKLTGKNATSTIDSSSGESLNSTNSSSNLNGIYEYFVDEDEPTDPEDSVISSAGLQLETGATVSTIVVHDDETFVGGNFSSTDSKFDNFFSIDSNGPVNPPEGGLNGHVNSMLIVDDLIFIGGMFTATKDKTTGGLEHACSYNVSTKTWVPLGAGLNGNVNDVVQVSLNLSTGTTAGLAFSGDFTEINADDSDKDAVEASGFAVWIPSAKNWLERLSTESVSIEGTISAAVTSGNATIYSGSISSNELTASGLVYLSSNTENAIASSGLEFVDSSSNSSLSKRDVVSQNFSGIYTGAFYMENGNNLTILGGRFSAKGNTSTVNNLAFVDGNNNDAVTGVTDEIDTQSTVLALAVVDTLLYAGGSLENSDGLNGVMIWDLETMALAADQPPGLQGDAVTVHAISMRPSKNQVFVGGTFDSAGSLQCPSLCVFDNKLKQWDIPGGDISGDVYVIHWVDNDKLIVGGNMTVNATTTYLSLYDAKSSTWGSIGGDLSDLPGPVTSVSMDTQYSTSLFIAGTSTDGKAYVMKLHDNKFTAIDNDFDDGTVIRAIQVLELKTSHDDSTLLGNDHTVLVTGSLHTAAFGNFSAATYNGSTWQPFLLSSQATGEPGSISSFISEHAPAFTTGGSKLAKGFVILISLAIALALVFLIVCAGVLASYVRRRREGYVPAPTFPGAEKSAAMQDRLPPQDLFGQPNSGRTGPMI